MKKSITATIFFALIAMNSYCQPSGELPTATALSHYKLSVGYHTTTVLIFPSPVQQADRGEKDLMAQKQPGVENVLMVKAARKDFLPTNLHVFTADGRVYAFDVAYTSDPTQTTFDLTMLLKSDSVKDNPENQIELSSKPLDRNMLANNIAKVKAAKPFFSSHTRESKMKIQLQTIWVSNKILYFGLEITNRSSLPYDIDFIRLYIQQKKMVTRSSIQERDIIPIYIDTIANIPAKSTVQWAFAIPLFTIYNKCKLVIQVEEKNGGRKLVLQIKNHQLLRSKQI